MNLALVQTFKVLLPEYHQAKTSEEELNDILIRGQGNILVVDDEEPIAESSCKLLSRLGYSAVTQTDSIKAIENVKNNPRLYDLILTDMTMPHLDGFELAKQIKEINPEIPIVLATGFSHGLTKEKCLSAGITDMVMKPMTASELSIIIEKAINKKEEQRRPMIRVLVIDDDPKICLFFETVLKKMDCVAFTARRINEAKVLSSQNDFDIILLDLELPDGNGLDIMPDLINLPSSPEIIIITGTGDARGAELAFKNGAWDFVQKPFRLDEVSLPIKRALNYRKEKLASREPVLLKRSKIIGESPALKKCLDEVGKAASTDASILVTGETGTGKELFAKAIHENSKRASKPFVAVDCGSLTETLIESTLFGHEKGSFTGASYKQEGLIVQADGGTLMLDEVGDLPLSIQKALLRTLQERCVRRIGGKKEIKVDIRLISATNLSLAQLIKDKSFREDFLYRIRAMEIHLPPLRDRGKDIEEIVLKKVHELSNRYKLGAKAVSKELLETLMSNHWPGNIRELLNVLEYTLASAGSDPTLVPKHLPPNYRLSKLTFEEPETREATQPMVNKALDSNGSFPSLNACREQLEKDYLNRLMKKAGGDRKTACRLSGVSQARLYALLNKYNLPGFGSYQ